MNDYFGEFRIPLDKIPEAKNWKVGKEYKITTEVEQMGINKERDYEPMMVKSKKKPKYKTLVTFKVKGISSKSEALKHKLHEAKETEEEEEKEHDDY